MARRLIGLDIGTNAVRVVELEPGEVPRVISFGQVALPPDAMREGEVVDRAAVTAAIQRLWKELSLRKGEVRVGVASPRVLVRTLDLPVMSEEDLAGALRFQAQELIPIPYEEAVLDFQVIEQIPLPDDAPTADGVPPQQMQRVLLAAAHREMVGSLVAAVSAAGLTVGAVDLVPLALIRAIGRRVSDDGGGAEAIVSIGGGVTVIVVHEAGLPRFVRVLGTGGRALTDAISRDLNIPYDQAEAVKRQTAQVPEDIAERARAAMARPIADLVEQVRGSIDYFRGQPGTPRLLQISLTGGGSLQPGLARQLGDLVGLPVEPAAPREQIEIGDIGFPEERIADIDPYLPTPAGLALGGLATGRRINLVGAARAGALSDRRAMAVAVAVAAVLILLLGGIWFLRKSSLDNEKDKLAAVQAENARLQQEKQSLAGAEQTASQIQTLQTQVESLLQNDISWARMLQEVARTIPNDTWLTAFQGTSATNSSSTSGTSSGSSSTSGSTPTTAPQGFATESTTSTTSSNEGQTGSSTTTSAPAGTPSTGSAAAGTVSFTVVGLDFPSVSAWIQRIGAQIPSFSDLWVPSATRGGGAAGSGSSGSSSTSTASSGSGAREFVNFTSTASITSAGRSDRLEKLQRSGR